MNRSLKLVEKASKLRLGYGNDKGVDVGHVDLHTAAGVIHYKFGNYTEIKKLVNYWLYQVESTDKD